MSRDSVPTPYAVHVHPMPSRFHGGVWTRPVFGMPYVHHVQNHLRPVTYGRETYLGGFGAEPTVVDPGVNELPLIVDAPISDEQEAKPVGTRRLAPDAPWGGNNGLFRTHGEGGGIFNQALAGLGDAGVGTLLTFVLGAAAGYGAFWYLSKKG